MIEMTLEMAQELIRTAPRTHGLAKAISDAAVRHPEQEIEWGCLSSALFVTLHAPPTTSRNSGGRFVSKPCPPSDPSGPTLFEQRMALIHAMLATRAK